MFFHLRGPDADGVGVAFTSAALDLGDASSRRGADAAAVSAALGVPLVIARQAHGRGVVRVGSDVAASSLVVAGEADALVTTQRGVALAVRVADCVPILLADTRAGVIGAVHAGRAGLLLGVIDAAVDAMAELGASEIVGWIGPHICGACYEVPPGMAADAAARLGVAVATTRWGSAGIDQTAAARAQLAARDVAVNWDAVACTYEHAELHSHRRDAGAAGRQAGLVWLALAPTT